MAVQKQVEFVISAVNNTKGTVDQVNRQLESFGKTAKNLAGLLGLGLGLRELTNFAKESVAAFKSQEEADTRLVSALAKTGQATRENIQALKDLANARQISTTFADEETISAQALLASYGLQVDKIKQLTPLLQDMAIMSAKATGGQADLENAARTVALAMDGGVNKLRQFGIAVSNEYEEKLKNAGTTTERVSILMEILQKTVGGVSDAMGKTAAAQATKLKNQFGEIKEQVGMAITYGFIPLISALTGVGKGLGETNTIALHLYNTFAFVTKGIIKLSGIVQDLGYLWEESSLAMDLNRAKSEGNAQMTEVYTNALKMLKEAQGEVTIEVGNQLLAMEDNKKSILDSIGNLQNLASEYKNVGTGVGIAGEQTKEATTSMQEEIKKLTDQAKDLKTQYIDALTQISNRFWGLTDEEMSALQQVASYQQEKMTAMEYEWKNYNGLTEEAIEIQKQYSKEYQDASSQAEQAQRRINELIKSRAIQPVSAVTEWAKGVRETITSKISSVTGGNVPSPVYPYLAPANQTPQGAISNFNFDFTNSFIGDKDSFIQQIISILNRQTQLNAVGGMK